MYSNRYNDLYNVIIKMNVNKDSAGFRNLLTLLTKCVVLEHVLFCMQSYIDYYTEINKSNQQYSLTKNFLMRLHLIPLEEALIDCTQLHERVQSMGFDMQMIDFECHIRKTLDGITNTVFPAVNAMYATVQTNLMKQVDKQQDLLNVYKLQNLLTNCQKCKRGYTYYRHKSCNHNLCTKCAFHSLFKIKKCLLCKKIQRLNQIKDMDSSNDNDGYSSTEEFQDNKYIKNQDTDEDTDADADADADEDKNKNDKDTDDDENKDENEDTDEDENKDEDTDEAPRNKNKANMSPHDDDIEKIIQHIHVTEQQIVADEALDIIERNINNNSNYSSSNRENTNNSEHEPDTIESLQNNINDGTCSDNASDVPETQDSDTQLVLRKFLEETNKATETLAAIISESETALPTVDDSDEILTMFNELSGASVDDQEVNTAINGIIDNVPVTQEVITAINDIIDPVIQEANDTVSLPPTPTVTEDIKLQIKCEPTGMEDETVDYFEYKFNGGFNDNDVVIKLERDEDYNPTSPTPVSPSKKRPHTNDDDDDDDDDVIIIEEESAVFKPKRPAVKMTRYSRVIIDETTQPANRTVKVEKTINKTIS